jgi:hypothetical protein
MTTPGVPGKQLGFLNLPDLSSSGMGGNAATGGRDDSPMSESLAKGSTAMGKSG